MRIGAISRAGIAGLTLSGFCAALVGVLLLCALSTLLSGTALPHAVRDVVFGAVVPVAVPALRDWPR